MVEIDNRLLLLLLLLGKKTEGCWKAQNGGEPRGTSRFRTGTSSAGVDLICLKATLFVGITVVPTSGRYLKLRFTDNGLCGYNSCHVLSHVIVHGL